jgi:hypothetical protein
LLVSIDPATEPGGGVRFPNSRRGRVNQGLAGPKATLNLARIRHKARFYWPHPAAYFSCGDHSLNPLSPVLFSWISILLGQQPVSGQITFRMEELSAELESHITHPDLRYQNPSSKFIFSISPYPCCQYCSLSPAI